MGELIIPERGSHWYYDNGQPCYELATTSKNAKNPTRQPTTKDALELGLCPGATAMNNMLYKPALENWKAIQLVLSALTLPRDRQESEDEFAKRVVKDAGAESRRAADFGTTVHAIAENYVQGVIPDNLSMVEMQFLEGFMLWARAHEITPLATEKSFCKWDEGFGGRVDFIGYIQCINWGSECGCETPLEGLYIVDWKTQNTKPGEPPRHYADWNVQLSGYKRGLELEADKLSVVISSTEPGRIATHVWDDPDNWGWECFKALRNLWYSPLGPGEKLKAARGYTW